jgi:hypothetical protein
VQLGAANNYTVFSSFHYPQVHIWIILLGRSLAAVAFGVGLGSSTDEIIFLEYSRYFSHLS